MMKKFYALIVAVSAITLMGVVGGYENGLMTDIGFITSFTICVLFGGSSLNKLTETWENEHYEDESI